MSEKTHLLESEQVFKIIREIEQNSQVTQRDLAKKLELSLGKVNFLINSIIDKGIIEVKNFKNARNKLAYMYLLTPAGIKIKLDLVQKFIIWKTQEYEKLKNEVESLKKEAGTKEQV